MEIDIQDELRIAVAESLPELDEIQDSALRQQVVDAWAYSLGQSTFKSIKEILASGNPDTPKLKPGTQTDHIRGVTQLTIALGDTLLKLFHSCPLTGTC